MFEFITQHKVWTGVVIYWIFSAAVSSMPDPVPNANAGYRWLFRFLHTIAGNITTAFAGKIPGLRTLLFLFVIPVLLATSACAARYTIHPGSLNKTDSAAYDVLLIAEKAIDEARVQYEAGRLPHPAAEALNALVYSYNVARESWLTYRGAVLTNSPPTIYFDQLMKNLSDLTNAIRAWEVVR